MELRLTRGHPRLFITPAQLPGFRRAASTFRRRYRGQLFEKLEPLLTSAPELRSRIRSGPEVLALALGQAWQLTHDERYGVAARWLMEGLEDFAHNHPIGYDTWGVTAEAAALLYDWLHDYWKSQRRDGWAARMALYCARRALDYTLRVYIVDDWHNYGLGLQAGALAGALSVGLDFPEYEDGALLKTLRALHFTGLESDEVFLQDGYHMPKTTRCVERALRAGNNAGFSGLLEATGGYHSVDVWEYVKFAEWWTSAIMPAARGNRIIWPELTIAGDATLHSMRPDNLVAPVGDSRAYTPHGRQSKILLHLHARTPRPQYAAWLKEHADLAAGPYPTHLLLHAPAGYGKEKVSMPTAAQFGPVSFLRSGWDKDAAFATFRCGHYSGGHNHLDSNAFSIFRGGPLAIDSGGLNYAARAYTEYVARTVAHNAILVRDPREKFWYGRYRKQTANDGGQRIMRVAYAPPHDVTGGPNAVMTEERRERLAGEFDTGHYVAFEPGPHADYIAGDATRAYTYPWSGLGDNPARRVEEAVRQILFIKPDLFIVFDRVESTRANFEKKWLLHTINAPVVWENGRRREVSRGIRTLPRDAVYEFTEQRGRLTVFPLLPQAREVRAIGGRGYEWWVEHAVDKPGGSGMNYPAGTDQEETGAWRIEIAPSRKAVRDCFLTVLHAGLGRERPARENMRCSAETRNNTAIVSIERKTRGGWREVASAAFAMRGRIAAEYSIDGVHARHSAAAPERVPLAKSATGRR